MYIEQVEYPECVDEHGGYNYINVGATGGRAECTEYREYLKYLIYEIAFQEHLWATTGDVFVDSRPKADGTILQIAPSHAITYDLHLVSV